MKNLDIQAFSQEFKTTIQKIYGERLAKLILYGSYARGTHSTESDIDFLIVLHDTKLHTGQEIRYLASVVAPLSMEYGIWISNYPTTLERFEHSDYLFYQNIRREGIEI